MVARSSLLRHPTPGARPARRTSSVVAALAALAPRLIRLARHDCPDRLLTEVSTHQEGDVAHPVREAPLVVVPGEHLAERVVHDPGEIGVEDRGVRRPVEVRGDERLLAVEEEAPERPRGGLLHGRVHLLLGREGGPRAAGRGCAGRWCRSGWWSSGRAGCRTSRAAPWRGGRGSWWCTRRWR